MGKSPRVFRVAAAVLLTTAVFIFFAVLPKNYTLWNKNVTVDILRADGAEEHYPSNVFGTVNRGDTVTVHVALPEAERVENGVVCFYVYHSVVEVYNGEELLYSHGADTAARGDMIGSVWPQIHVPESAWGGELTIKLAVMENGAFSKIRSVQMYTEDNAYWFHINPDLPGYMISLTCIIAGCLAALTLLTSMKGGTVRRRGLYICWFAIDIGAWILTNNGMQYLLVQPSYLIEQVEFITVFSITYPLLLFVYEAENVGKLKAVFGWAMIANGVFFTVATVLHFLNIAHYCETLLISHIMTLVGIALLLWYSVANIHKNEASRLFFVGMLLMGVVGAFDVVVFNLLKYIPALAQYSMPTMLALAALFFTVFLMLSYYAESADARERAMVAAANEKRITKIIDSIPAGVCTFHMGNELKIDYANSFFYKILGYTVEEARAEGFTSLHFPLTEAGEKRLNEGIGSFAGSGRQYAEIDLECRHRTGSKMVLNCRVFADPEAMDRISVNIVDVTQRNNLQEELRISEETYRIASELATNYICQYNLVTRCMTFLFDSMEVLGVPQVMENMPDAFIALGLLLPGGEESLRTFHQAMVEGSNPDGQQVVYLRSQATDVQGWCLLRYRLLYDKTGHPLYAIIAAEDITEAREQELAFDMHRQSILSMPKETTEYFEFDLNQDVCQYAFGNGTERLGDISKLHWSDMVSHAVEHGVYPEDREKLQRFLNKQDVLQAYQHGQTTPWLDFRRVEHGGVQWYRVSLTLSSDRYTKNIKANCLVGKVDDQAAEAKQLAEDVSSLKNLLASVPAGICVFRLDEALTIIQANEVFYEIFGYTSETAAAEGFTSLRSPVVDDGQARMREMDDRLMDENGGVYEMELNIHTRTGDRKTILCKFYYEGAESGHVTSNVVDITDRKLMEEELRISEERYRLALKQSGKVFFFFDVPSRSMRLSEELAQLFGLPTVVDNMPDNFISQGLVEPESVENYRSFYQRIYAGEPTGDTIISCHMRNMPDQVLWYRIAFTSVFDDQGKPSSAVITYEDLMEQRTREIAGAWKQLNLLAVPEKKYVIAEYNLTKNRILSQVGGLFAAMPEFVTGYDEINAFVIANFIYEEDKASYTAFLDRARVLAMLAAGHQTEDSIEYRSLQSGSAPRWTRCSIQVIRDPYSGDALAQLFIEDIHEERSGMIEMQQNMDELTKELENSRIKVMVNQMQPHFLYNALSAIRTIVKSDPDYAYDLLYDFTTHLRSSIKALSSDDPIPFNDELKNIKAYLNIEKMRFGDDLQVNYEIDSDDFKVIPLSIQPLAENAARHGVYPKGQDGGTVTVRTYETVDAYIIEVEDDGVGFDVDEVLNRNSDSVGLKSLIFRLKSLMNADVSIQSKIGVGTRSVVTIPKKKEQP